ncbi:AraC family transcriptional regulator [Vallitalea guaymasensis]|uniref:AraC family transcriptional regulator n=1 Tax=Vallitalea guaymasensis TaxID=1185412 RepID=UPI0023557C42|nr:AraC family transcriptional regulator [Vallitalea guaymasensis]
MLLEKMYFEEICPYVRNVGIEVFNKTRTSIRRIYDHEFILGFEGSTNMTIEDRTYTIGKDDLILIKPNIPHEFKITNKDSGVIYWVHFDFKHFFDGNYIDYKNMEFNESLYKNSLEWNSLIRKDPVFENGFRFPEFTQLKNSTIIRDIFVKLNDTFNRQEMFWQLECRHLMLQFFNIYLKEFYKEYSYHKNTSSSNISDYMQEYVNKNIRNKLTLKSMSGILGYNSEYLGKIFIKETGEPFSDYVNKIRLKKAFELMKTSSLTLSNISELCGFSDSFYFSKVMKKYTNKSPREIKKSLKSNNEF